MTKSLRAATLISLTVAMNFGCMKKPSHQADYGPEIEVSAVNQALTELVGSFVAPASIKVGEFHYSETTLSYNATPPEVIGQFGITVAGIREESQKYVVTVRTEKSVYKDGKLVRDPLTEGEFCEPKPGTEGACGTAVSATEAAPAQRITFHNLKKETIDYPVPGLVRFRVNCGGIPNCDTIRARVVSYDKVVWDNQESGTKRSYRIVASADTPYYSSVLSNCRQDWENIQGQVIPVSICVDTKDFTFGN